MCIPSPCIYCHSPADGWGLYVFFNQFSYVFKLHSRCVIKTTQRALGINDKFYRSRSIRTAKETIAGYSIISYAIVKLFIWVLSSAHNYKKLPFANFRVPT